MWYNNNNNFTHIYKISGEPIYWGGTHFFPLLSSRQLTSAYIVFMLYMYVTFLLFICIFFGKQNTFEPCFAHICKRLSRDIMLCACVSVECILDLMIWNFYHFFFAFSQSQSHENIIYIYTFCIYGNYMHTTHRHTYSYHNIVK